MRNYGLITNESCHVNAQHFQKYREGHTSLVAQGGGQRGIFTSGVLDAFMTSNFDCFDSFYGTSAGALNLCAYLCRQPGLGKSFILDLTTDDRFFNLFAFIRRKQLLGLDWTLDKICEYPYKLDIDMGRKVLGSRKAYASTTDIEKLQDHYFPMLQDNWKEVLRATSAIPSLYDGSVTLNNQEYVDGGVSASVAVQEAWRREARAIIIIRTECIDNPNSEVPIIDTDTHPSVWYRDSINSIQSIWEDRLDKWRLDWNGFLKDQFAKVLASDEKAISKQKPIDFLNGGRWLFGADDIYRLSHMLGNKFDSGLADMIMVHYQTYALTQEFIQSPPDDCFIIQVAPAQPLESTSLLSDRESLIHDYEVGYAAGLAFIEYYQESHL